MSFYITIIHQRIQTTRSHTLLCHHYHFCTIDFVLFHNVTHYTNSLLSRFHVNKTDLVNIICTLLAAGTVLGRLEYNNHPGKATLTGRTCFPWISLQRHGQWNFVASTHLLVFLDCWKQLHWSGSRCTAGHCNFIEAQEAHQGWPRSRSYLPEQAWHQFTTSQDRYLGRDAWDTWHYPTLIPCPLPHQLSQRYQPTMRWHVPPALVKIIITYPLAGTEIEVIGFELD